MLEPAATVAVSVQFRDRDGSESATRFSLPFLSSLTEVISFLEVVIPVLQGLSDATIYGFTAYWKVTDHEPALAAEGSDTNRKIAIYYRNDIIYEAQFIPSPKEEIWETEGAYAGLRVMEDSPAYPLYLSGLVALAPQLVGPEGEPWPTEFVVAGKVL